MLRALCAVALVASAPQALQSAPLELWKLGAEVSSVTDTDRRLAPIDLGDLAWAGGTAASHVVTVPLFDDVTTVVELERRSSRANGGLWYGTFGRPEEHLSLSVVGDVAHGSLLHRGRAYEIRWEVGHGHVLALLAPENFAPCGCGAEHAVVTPAERGARQPVSGGPVAMADVLVAYTPAARSAAGGVNGIESLIEQAAFRANLSYANANAGFGIRIVHTYETSYSESGSSSTDLARFRSTGDSYMPEVHGLRNTWGADACVLLTQTGSACGVGYLMTNVSGGFQSSAFNVTRRGCAVGNLTFAHELGHNFGCAHDRGNAGSASRPWAYGYRTPNSQYRTVMAYSPGSRVPIVSGPNGTWNGNAMGVTNLEDNARALTQNGPTIGNWRPTVVPIVDCDADGVDDELEIALGTGEDLNGDGQLDNCVDFTALPDTLGVQSGGAQILSLTPGTEYAGHTYYVLSSISGTSPGVPYQGITIPLVFDDVTLFSLTNANSGVLQGSVGTVAPEGVAASILVIPPAFLPASFEGVVMHHAYLLISPQGQAVYASNPVSLSFVNG